MKSVSPRTSALASFQNVLLLCCKAVLKIHIQKKCSEFCFYWCNCHISLYKTIKYNASFYSCKTLLNSKTFYNVKKTLLQLLTLMLLPRTICWNTEDSRHLHSPRALCLLKSVTFKRQTLPPALSVCCVHVPAYLSLSTAQSYCESLLHMLTSKWKQSIGNLSIFLMNKWY